MAGFRYYMVLEDGEPADPAMFLCSEPPGRWKVGDVAMIRPGVEYRILNVQSAPEGGNGPPWAGERAPSGR